MKLENDSANLLFTRAKNEEMKLKLEVLERKNESLVKERIGMKMEVERGEKVRKGG